MDEPTSVLTPQEVTNLFKTLEALIKEGLTVLYITHKLEEVINICDYVTIMRNGKVIDSCSIDNHSAETLATKMLGERLGKIKTDYFIIFYLVIGQRQKFGELDVLKFEENRNDILTRFGVSMPKLLS